MVEFGCNKRKQAAPVFISSLPSWLMLPLALPTNPSKSSSSCSVRLPLTTGPPLTPTTRRGRRWQVLRRPSIREPRPSLFHLARSPIFSPR